MFELPPDALSSPLYVNVAEPDAGTTVGDVIYPVPPAVTTTRSTIPPPVTLAYAAAPEPPPPEIVTDGCSKYPDPGLIILIRELIPQGKVILAPVPEPLVVNDAGFVGNTV